MFPTFVQNVSPRFFLTHAHIVQRGGRGDSRPSVLTQDQKARASKITRFWMLWHRLPIIQSSVVEWYNSEREPFERKEQKPLTTHTRSRGAALGETKQRSQRGARREGGHAYTADIQNQFQAMTMNSKNTRISE